MRHLRLLAQLAGTMAAVVVLALALTTLLNALRFQETFEDLLVRRLDVMVQDVASDLLVGVDLGLSLDAMGNLDAVVARHHGSTTGVASIRIHDCQGRLLASSGGDAAAEHIPKAYLQQRNWHRFDEKLIALGTTLRNSYGQCAGSIVVEYESGVFRQARAVVVEYLVGAALVSTLLIVPAVGLLAWLFLRRYRLLRSLRLDLEALSAPADGQAVVPAEPRLSAAGDDDELLDAYHAARPVLQAERGLPAHETPRQAGHQTASRGWVRAIERWLGSPVARVLILTSLTLFLALLFVSAKTADMLRDTLLPELARKGVAQSRQAGQNVQRALDLRIPIDAIVGVDALYDELRRDDKDLAFMAIVASDGRILHAAGLGRDEVANVFAAPVEAPHGALAAEQGWRAGFLVSSVPLRSADGQAVIGHVRLGLRESSLTRPIEENLADLLVVLLVSLFIAFELMLLVVTVHVTLPVRATRRVLGEIAGRRFGAVHAEFARDELGRIARRLNEVVLKAARRRGIVPVAIREPRLVGVRLLAFLFVCAEELARPIMPAFFGQLTAATGGGSAHIGAGGVMALHMAVIAVAMPLGSMLYARIGRRRMYAAGALLATAGLLGTGLAESLGQLLWWRAVSGLGYAMTFVACQGFVIESTNDGNRARGSAMMVGGIMLADICGPAIGGILAAWIGHSATFVLGAGLAATAALLTTFLMDRHSDHADQPPRVSLGTFALVLHNRRLVAVLLFAAVPAKVMLGGLLYYLTPLALLDLGANEAQTGRILMLYGLVALLTGPFFAGFTDRFQRPVLALAIGGLITAIGVVPMANLASFTGIALGVLALGIAQSLSIPALVAAVLALSQRAVAEHGQGPVMAVLRLLERLGGAAGPLAAAALASYLGVSAAMEVFAAYVLVSTLLLVLFMRLTERRKHRRQPAGSASGTAGLP